MKRNSNHLVRVLIVMLSMVIALAVLPVLNTLAADSETGSLFSEQQNTTDVSILQVSEGNVNVASAVPTTADPLTIKLTCSNGENGWGGNALRIYIDGALHKTLTIGSGYAGLTTEIDYDPTKMYEFQWSRGTTQNMNAQFEILQGSTVLHKATEVDCYGYLDQQNVYVLNQRFTLNLTDSYGDGWNGNKLVLYVDGTAYAEYTVPTSGKNATFMVPQEEGKLYEFRWTKGTYSSECSFTITNGSKTLVSATSTKCNSYSAGQTVYSTAPTVITSGTCGSNANYTLYSDGELVISGSGSMYNIWESYSHAPWWDYRGYIKRVTIGANITGIGQWAFFYCGELTNVTIEGTVSSIPHGAFYHCDSLESFTIPNSVTAIGDTAFAFCTSLKSIIVPYSVKTIGDNAFWDCTSMTHCTIWGMVTSIGKQAFCGCSSLTEMYLPDTLTSLGEGAFWGCTNLSYVLLSNKIPSLGYSTFYKCRKLSEIEISASVKTIATSAFEDCTNLKSVYFLIKYLSVFNDK